MLVLVVLQMVGGCVPSLLPSTLGAAGQGLGWQDSLGWSPQG